MSTSSMTPHHSEWQLTVVECVCVCACVCVCVFCVDT